MGYMVDLNIQFISCPAPFKLGLLHLARDAQAALSLSHLPHSFAGPLAGATKKHVETGSS